jgi:hypothetical protein
MDSILHLQKRPRPTKGCRANDDDDDCYSVFADETLRPILFQNYCIVPLDIWQDSLDGRPAHLKASTYTGQRNTMSVQRHDTCRECAIIFLNITPMLFYLV